jgi:hypothetical protein
MIAAIVEPTPLLQTVVVDSARHVIEGVAQEVYIASLVGRLGQNLAQGRPSPT